MEKFSKSDAWVLQSIARASICSPADLKDVISTGSMMNHVIFTAGELQNGLYKLYQSKYIEQKDGLYSLTPFGQDQMSEVINANLLPMNERNKISEIIGASEWSSDECLPKYNPELNPIFFTPEVFENACKKHQKEAWAIIKKNISK